MSVKVGLRLGRPGGGIASSLWEPISSVNKLIVPALTVGALSAAAYSAWHAYTIFYDRPLDFDDTLPWYALAFALLVYAAWSPAMAGVATWPARAARYVRQHPLEMALLLAILGAGIFIRVWKYGILPPSNFLCCEEAINAGVAGDIEAGARPLNYPLVRYSTAFGLWAFGNDTDGLRLPFVMFGIAAIVPFYLLMRELVRTPAALFATALFASMHSLGDTSIHFQPGLLVSVSFAFALVRGLKTANPFWWLLAGLLAAELSYEYETFKLVPLVVPFFVLAALARVLFWPPTRHLRALGSRAWGIAKRAWFPALIFGLAAAIAVTPMLARKHHGEDIYRDSLNRQQAGREATGLERYLSPLWKDQTRWVTQIYTPFVEQQYPRGTSLDASGVIDKATSVLLWGGALAATLMFWRRWRLLFLMWFLGGSAALALLVQNFAAWKLAGFIPPGIVLIGFLVDDVWGFVGRYHRVFTIGLSAALLVAIGFVFGANVLIQRSNASSAGVLRGYAIPSSETYATCHYLQGRPESNYTFVSQWSLGGWGFAQPRFDRTSERLAWQNEFFVCRGLEGATVPSGEEIWPPRGNVEGPVTLALTGSLTDVAAWREALERAMPDLDQPAFTLNGPDDVFQVVAYEPPPGYLAQLRGLWLTYQDSAGRVQEEPTGPADIALSDLAGGGDARLQALVYIGVGAEAPRALVVSGADGLVRIDGQETFSSQGGRRSVTPVALSEGWHVVEASVRSRGGNEPVRLRWERSAGIIPAFRQDFFALPDMDGWLHTRSIAHAGGFDKSLARFDYEPHTARRELTHPVFTRQPPSPDWTFADDVWAAVWHVPQAATYHLEVVTPGSEVELLLDGQPLPAQLSQSPDGVFFIAAYDVPVSRGGHPVELRFHLTRGDLVGGRLAVTDEAGQEVELDVSPY